MLMGIRVILILLFQWILAKNNILVSSNTTSSTWWALTGILVAFGLICRFEE